MTAPKLPKSKLSHTHDSLLRTLVAIENEIGPAPVLPLGDRHIAVVYNSDEWNSPEFTAWRQAIEAWRRRASEIAREHGSRYGYSSAGAPGVALREKGLLEPGYNKGELHPLTPAARKLVAETSPTPPPAQRAAATGTVASTGDRPRTGTFTGEIKANRAERLADKEFTDHVKMLTLALNDGDQARAMGFGDDGTSVTHQVGDEVLVDTFGRLRRGIVTRVGTKNARVAYATPSGGYVQETDAPKDSLWPLVDPTKAPKLNRAALLPKQAPTPTTVVRRGRTEEEKKAAQAKEREEQKVRDKKWAAEKVNDIRTRWAEREIDRRVMEYRGWTYTEYDPSRDMAFSDKGLKLVADEIGFKIPARKADRDNLKADLLAAILKDVQPSNTLHGRTLAELGIPDAPKKPAAPKAPAAAPNTRSHTTPAGDTYTWPTNRGLTLDITHENGKDEGDQAGRVTGLADIPGVKGDPSNILITKPAGSRTWEADELPDDGPKITAANPEALARKIAARLGITAGPVEITDERTGVRTGPGRSKTFTLDEEPAAAPVWVDRATGEPVANPTQVDIVRGFVVQEQDRVPAATMGQAPAATAKALNQASSVVEGQAILARRDRGQLAAIAIELGMPQAMVGRYTKEDLKAAIIQKAIQARLNSAAIRDQANYDIYSSGQRPASAGPYRDVKDGRDMTAPDVTLPPFGAEVIDSITNATSNSQARSYLNTESLAYLKKLAAHPDVAVAFASSVKKDDLIDAIVRRLYGRAATADAVERAVNRPKA